MDSVKSDTEEGDDITSVVATVGSNRSRCVLNLKKRVEKEELF